MRERTKACRTPDCRRPAINGWAFCDDCLRRFLGAAESRELRQLAPKPPAEMSELELRFLYGDR